LHFEVEFGHLKKQIKKLFSKISASIKLGSLFTRKMPERISKLKRSQIMRAVKSKRNISTELALIEILKTFKIRGWRRNYILFGSPDFVFPKKKIVIFADGCFWHGHKCRNTKPASNIEYWNDKLKRNKKRDRLVTKELISRGWQVIRIWECTIKSKSKLPSKLVRFLSELQK